MRLTYPLLVLLLCACAAPGPGPESYERLARLRLQDLDDKVLWTEDLSLGELFDDEGYPLQTLGRGRLCVGDGPDACARSRDLDVRLNLRVRSETSGALTIAYHGQVDVLQADRQPALPTETRYPKGQALVNGEQAAEVELVKGLTLVIELPVR